MIDAGHVNPAKLLFTRERIYSIEMVSEKRKDDIDDLFERKAVKLFREHTFQDSPDFVNSVNQILSSKDFKRIFNFN